MAWVLRSRTYGRLCRKYQQFVVSEHRGKDAAKKKGLRSITCHWWHVFKYYILLKH